jgi:CDP-diacylglycerol--glycerol-3-phosphate 3-phosphatidyltransferase
MRMAFDETRRMWRESDERKAKRRELMASQRIFTLANLLSLVRLGLIPLVLLALLVGRQPHNWIALSLLLVAALTDFLDGYLARSRNEISQLGRIIDPVADKLFTGSLGLILVVLRGLPAWFVGLYVLRDLIILTISYLLFLNRDIVMSANLLGKGATVVLMATLVAYTVGWPGIGYPLVWLGTLLIVSSGLVYARSFALLVARLASGGTRETGNTVS